MPTLPTIQPVINDISIFNARNSKKVSLDFDSIFLPVLESITFTIRCNEDNTFEYTETQGTIAKSFIIGANILTNGKTYTITATLNFQGGYYSTESESKFFRCGYATAEFLDVTQHTEFENPPITVNTSITEVGESLASYKYQIYEMLYEDYINDSFQNASLLCESDTYYDNEHLEYTLPLISNGYYAIKFVGTGTYGSSIETSTPFLFQVNYKKTNSNIILDHEVDKVNGYIKLSSFIKNAQYRLENDHYSFSYGVLTLDHDNSLTYHGGFDFDGDFLLYINVSYVEMNDSCFLSINNGEITLSVVKIFDTFYLKLLSGNYVLYEEIPSGAAVNYYGDFCFNGGSSVIIKLKRIGMAYELEMI